MQRRMRKSCMHDGTNGCRSLVPTCTSQRWPGSHRGVMSDFKGLPYYHKNIFFLLLLFLALPFVILTLAAPSSVFNIEFSGMTKAECCHQHTPCLIHLASHCSRNVWLTFSPLLLSFCCLLCFETPSHLFPSGKFLSSLMAQENALSFVMLSVTFIPKEYIPPVEPQTYLSMSLITCAMIIHIHVFSLATCGFPSGRDLVLFIWLFPAPSP